MVLYVAYKGISRTVPSAFSTVDGGKQTICSSNFVMLVDGEPQQGDEMAKLYRGVERTTRNAWGRYRSPDALFGT